MAKTWKNHEKRVAQALGGKRVSGPWQAGPDVVSDWIVAECKARTKLPEWVVKALKQAQAAAGEFQLPIAVLHQKNQRSENDLVVMTMRDFKEWFGGNGSVPESHVSE